MIKFLLTFASGVYAGMYVAQNYEVPKVDDPGKLVERLKGYVDDKMKDVEKKKND